MMAEFMTVPGNVRDLPGIRRGTVPIPGRWVRHLKCFNMEVT